MDKIDQFNWWLTCIPDRILELKETLPAEVAESLDGSLLSLDVLEAYLLKTYPPRTLTLPENRLLLDQLASYVGDVAEKNIEGAMWDIEIDDPQDVNYNFPVLEAKGYAFNPFSTVTASIHRKKGNYIRDCIEGYKQI